MKIITPLVRQVVNHYSLGKLNLFPIDVEKWLAELPIFLVKNFQDSNIVLYQSGADPWIHDPLGGLMTKKQLAKRYLIVFKFAIDNQIHLVWNLAGGYRKPFGHVLDIHNNSMAICLNLINKTKYPLQLDDNNTKL